MAEWNLKDILDSGAVDQSIVDAVKRLKLAIEDIQNLQAELDAKLSQIYTSGAITGDGTQSNPLTVNLPSTIGDMKKADYDTNDNGVVDNAERLGGKLPDEYASKAHQHLSADVTDFEESVRRVNYVEEAYNARHNHPNKALLDSLTNSGDGSQYLGDDGNYHPVPEGGGGGDMFMVVYDVNGDGIVDNSERLGGKLPSEFASATHSHTLSDITDFKVYVDGTTIAGDGTPGNPLRVIGGVGDNTIDGNDNSTTLDGGNATDTGSETIDGGTA